METNGQAPASRAAVKPDSPRFSKAWLWLLVAGPVGCWVLTAGDGRDTVFHRYTLRGFLFGVMVSYVALTASYLLYASGTFRKRLFAVLTLTTAGLVMLGALELPAALHLIDYRIVLATPFRKSWENPRNRLDRELLHIHTAYDHFAGAIPGDLVEWYDIDTDRRYKVDVRYDKRGFRNHLDRDTADIVMIGDSFVEGPIVSYNRIASTRLERSLQTSVLNLGQTGYGPQQEGAVLRRFALPAKPRVVIWVLYEGNDLIPDLLRYQRSTADWDRYVAGSHGFVKRSFSRNILKFLARKTSTPTRDPSKGLARSGILQTPGEHPGERIYFAYTGKALSPSDRTLIATGEEIIQDAQRRCAERGIRFLLVFAPTKYRVYHDLCLFDPKSEIAGWVVNELTETIAAWSEADGIAFLDLTPALQQAAKKGTLVYYLDDGHWNAQGHTVAAEQIASFLNEIGWLGDIAKENTHSFHKAR